MAERKPQASAGQHKQSSYPFHNEVHGATLTFGSVGRKLAARAAAMPES